jgi:hypothetical protein
MEILLYISLLLFPTSAVFFTTYLFLNKQHKLEVINLNLELKKERQKFFLPNRVEAYQRAVLFLERISPNSLVMRMHNPGLPARVLQADLLKTIREEYDHNVAQQLFITIAGWDMLRSSKEETIKIINLAGNQMGPTAMGIELSSKIFEICAEVGKLPTEITIDYLKKELQENF